VPLVIVGAVNSRHEATIRLRVRGPTGHETELDAVIDTGFTGYLTLPGAEIAALGLAWFARGLATLADGSSILYDVYEAIAVWDGQPCSIPVDEANTVPLVGMLLLDSYKLTVEARIGGAGTIAAIP
jgi:clan AA aspartic protease